MKSFAATILRRDPESPKASGWKPIETVPKDGTCVLLFSPDSLHPVVIGYQSEVDDDEYFYPQDDTTLRGAWFDVAFTHWQPLPAPPATDGEAR